MDNQRLLIWAFFGLMAWITYQTWMQDYGPKPATPPAAVEAVDAEQPAIPDDGGLPTITDATIDAPAPVVADAPAVTPAATAPVVRVLTDVLDVEISTQGGTIQSATLRRYPVAKDRPDDLVVLLSTEDLNYGAVQTGIRTAGAPAGTAEPTHQAMFTAPQSNYALNDGEELVVPLRWTGPDGITVEKRFTFRRGGYAIDIEQELTNNSGNEWRGAAYAQVRRRFVDWDRSMFDVDSYSFSGPITYDGDKAEKRDRDDLLEDGPVKYKSSDGWVASIEHHFVTAIVPARGTDQSYTVSARGERSTASALGSTTSVGAGESAVFETTAFVGPKLQSQLEDIDESLKLTVDYGWLTLLSNPMFWVLSFIHDFVGNWGVAIILMTLLIKLIFYKLTESSGRSMAKMRQLQPRMQALQERYKDDRQALSQAMMDLYKREKVNPAAGCLPILIQMPFFLAFYWVLLESVEMRQAPFMLWITDLSSRDPYFILPIIMGAAMLFQQKLNPAPADPVQAKVMQIMPIMFTVFFAFFPSGLVLYWVTNTLLSIAQQWKINKVVEKEAAKRRKN
ncbi:MAG: membrane protein insertase YidC [Pseudomonadota bacterium]